MSKNPQYTKGLRGQVATRCRLCGKQLTYITEIQQELHDSCIRAYKSEVR
tara:strand:+ start:68 stop:217 length:150 start_codon:yes stop_codon:yes gene_type:complete